MYRYIIRVYVHLTNTHTRTSKVVILLLLLLLLVVERCALFELGRFDCWLNEVEESAAEVAPKKTKNGKTSLSHIATYIYDVGIVLVFNDILYRYPVSKLQLPVRLTFILLYWLVPVCNIYMYIYLYICRQVDHSTTCTLVDRKRVSHRCHFTTSKRKHTHTSAITQKE